MEPPRPKTLKPRRNSIRTTQRACHHLVIVTSSKYDIDTVPVPNPSILEVVNRAAGSTPESKRRVYSNHNSCSTRSNVTAGNIPRSSLEFVTCTCCQVLTAQRLRVRSRLSNAPKHEWDSTYQHSGCNPSWMPVQMVGSDGVDRLDRLGHSVAVAIVNHPDLSARREQDCQVGRGSRRHSFKPRHPLRCCSRSGCNRPSPPHHRRCS
jgi:hypothetical protein